MSKSNLEISKLSKGELIKNRKMRHSVKRYLEELNKIDPNFIPFDYTTKKNKKMVEDLVIYHRDSSDLKDMLDKYKSRKRTYSTMRKGYSSDSSGGKKRKTIKNIKGGSGPKQFEVAEIGETGGASDKASSLINAEIQQLGATQAENSQYEKNMPTDNESYNLGKVIGGGKKKQKNKKKHKNTQKKQKK